MAGRVSQTVLEIESPGSPNARTSQVVLETGEIGPGNARLSQIVVEAGDIGPGYARISQLVVEAGDIGPGHLRASGLVVEILSPSIEVPVPAIYPSLVTLGFSVIKRPKWCTGTDTHVSGREVRVAYWANPLWEWELTYELLRDGVVNGADFDELKTLMGFLNAQSGSLQGFLFKDPDDNTVVNQALATTDGILSTWTLQRTYGAEGFTGTEPIGYVDMAQPFNLRVDGALKAQSDPTWGYTVVQLTPVNQLLKFNNTPSAGHVLTVDMSYYYFCRFADDANDFEKFMRQLWTLKKVKLMSLRG